MASTASQQVKTEGAAPWRGFRSGLWQKQIDVRDFIQQNYEPYEGDDSFLASATERTDALWEKLNQPDPLQPGPRAGAEPDDLVLAAPARGLPPLRGQGRHRHQLAPVRERRDHAPRLGDDGAIACCVSPMR